MTRTRVRSSVLASVGYDASTSTLEIRFHSGGVYRYAPVPPAIHEALMTAPSKGEYFTALIRPRWVGVRIR